MSGIFRFHSVDASEKHRITSPFCVSPGQLQDATTIFTGVHGSPSMNFHNSGFFSSNGGRSVREFEEQMATLRKENFNLKLRIYFLEEKLPNMEQYNSVKGQESLMKQFIDNKVETEMLRRELEENQQLLKEAAEALTHMENIQKETESKNQQIFDDLNQKIQLLELENQTTENANCDNNDEMILNNLMGRTVLEGDIDLMHKVREMEGFVCEFKKKNSDLSLQIKELEQVIKNKNELIENLEKNAKELNFQNMENLEILQTLKNDDSKQPFLLNESKYSRSMKEIKNFDDDWKTKFETNEKLLKYLERVNKTVVSLKDEAQNLRNQKQENLSAELKGTKEDHSCKLFLEQIETILTYLSTTLTNNDINTQVSPQIIDTDSSQKDLTNFEKAFNTKLNEINSNTTKDIIKKQYSTNLTTKLFDSDSDSWSEPDRNVSLARIGLDDSLILTNSFQSLPKTIKESTLIDKNQIENVVYDNDTMPKFNNTKLGKKMSKWKTMLLAKDNKILELQCELLEANNNLQETIKELKETKYKIEEYKTKNDLLQTEIDSLNAEIKHLLKNNINNDNRYSKLIEDKNKYLDISKNQRKSSWTRDILNDSLDAIDYQSNYSSFDCNSPEYKNKNEIIENLKLKVRDFEYSIESMKENETEMKNLLIKNEKTIRAMRKVLDEKTILLSKVILERSKINNEKLKLEGKLNKLIMNLDFATNKDVAKNKQMPNQNAKENVEPNHSVQQLQHRLENISPDLGIDSENYHLLEY